MMHFSVHTLSAEFGRVAYVTSGDGSEAILDLMPQAHNSPDGCGIVGHSGFASFLAAVDDASAWQRAPHTHTRSN